MTGLYDLFARPALFALDAENAHGLSIKALKAGVHPSADNGAFPRLRQTIAGLDFPNPLGMAAGYDKDAEVPGALLAMGFGFTEVGTVTPLPQPGNPRPRIFRMLRDDGVINRLGFNSKGHDEAHRRLLARKTRNTPPKRVGPVGVNLGANKTSDDFAADYVQGIERFFDVADYFTVNISSPNTPGLRALQGQDPLESLLSRVSAARLEKRAAGFARVPVFLKVAPDLDDDEMATIAEVLLASDFDGLIVSNTTLSREGLKSANHDEAGGLSGAPLFERSTIVLARMRKLLGKDNVLIGVGGISSGENAWTKLEAGANLLQLYTGMIFKGPTLPSDIVRYLGKRMEKEGLTSVAELTGSATGEWAGRALPQ